MLFKDTECPVARQWSPTPVGLSRFVSSLNLWLSIRFSLANVCVSAVVVTCDVVDSPTLVFFQCLTFRVNYHGTGAHYVT